MSGQIKYNADCINFIKDRSKCNNKFWAEKAIHTTFANMPDLMLTLIKLRVIIMSLKYFRVNLHSIVCLNC